MIIRSIVATGRKQCVNRLVERLAPKVPQCDVDRADRLDVSALAAEIARERIELFPDPYRLISGPIYDKRREYIVDTGSDRIGRAALPPFSPANEAVIGFDLNN